MSSVIESTSLIDKLVKAKIPKQTATELVDFVEKHQSAELKKDIEWLKWCMGVLMGLIIGLASIMIYLHSDLKSDMKSEMNRRFERVDSQINQINQKLDRLLIK